MMHKLTVCASLAIVMLLEACGDGGTLSSSGTAADAAANVQPVKIDAGPANGINFLFTSVTICSPGSTANCQTIDHIQVDTGSSGLRVMASVLPASFVLPQQTYGGNAVAECAQFADGSSWGPVKIAIVKLSGEAAASVPIQVIGDPAFIEPQECHNTGPSENTVDTFGANGVLGVGEFKQDCGSACATYAGNGFYYICNPCDSSTNSSALSSDLQVANPIAMFANDNNGVIVEIPSINSAGAATVSGALVFGIDTQPNNGLGSAQVFKTATDTGYFVTNYKGPLLSG